MSHLPAEAQREHVNSSQLYQILFLADMAGNHILKLKLGSGIPSLEPLTLKKSLILPLKGRVP